MEKKCHLESKKCQGKPPEPSTSSESIVKRDNGYLCLLCNTVIKHSNNKKRHQKLCKKGLNKPLFTCNVCNKQSKFKSKLDRHVQIHAISTFTCSICLQDFKREDHLKYHEVICINEIQVPTMVDMLIKSDKSVPEVESVGDETLSENNDPNKINDTVDVTSTAAFSHDAIQGTIAPDETVNVGENADLIAEQEVPESIMPPRRCQNRLAKSHQKMLLNINSMLQVVEEKEKEKILNLAMGREQEYFTKATINYFSKLIKDARCTFCSKTEGAKLLLTILGDKLNETEYQVWLVDVLRLKDRNELLSFMKYMEEDKITFTPWGCKLLDSNEHESTYNFWKVNSETSVHRSNGQHMINISKENIQIQVSDIPDVELTTVETKRGIKLQAHGHVTTIPYKVLSYGSFINLKRFYVSQPKEKETEMCLCSKCLNQHCLYKAIRSAIDTDLQVSLSQYLCKNMTCEWKPETHLHSRTCIVGQCDKNWEIVNINADLKKALPKKPKQKKYITMCLKLLKHNTTIKVEN